jgi:hypothetical protein
MWDIDSARNVASSVGLRRSRIDKKDFVSSLKSLVQIPGVDLILEFRFVISNLIVHMHLLPDQQARLDGISSHLTAWRRPQ